MKRSRFIILIVCMMLISSCGKVPTQNEGENHNNDFNSLTTSEISQNDESIEFISEYFRHDVVSMNYEGYFEFLDGYNKEVRLNIKLIEKLKNGRLFELYLDPLDGVPEERLCIGYFYVLKEKIYKIKPTEENLDMIKSKGTLPEDSIIVCQNTELPDDLEKEEKGFHHYIVVNDDEIEYHSYNNLVTTGYYESYTWKKDVGLICYQKGYGAGRESIELKLISNDE
ncbi:hypothetical protein [Abyssisolibacter fermentans]|uniref:hypothetical protein n=1 Tax=Abyssisolibacter fermentans TaxID=1766203 RepID=UPI0012E3D5C9|nr:hypothetical protein [Abyssisolibacter fermentans]